MGMVGKILFWQSRRSDSGTMATLLGSALAVQSLVCAQEAGRAIARPESAAFPSMHLGLFAHYMHVGKPYAWGATEWADGTAVQNLDELADNLDVENFAECAAAMRAQYVIFTTWHANMNALYPSTVMAQSLPGHCSRRDAVGDLIQALKAKDIRTILYIHPSDAGPDFTREDQDRVGWNDEAPYRRWNDFVNAVVAELVDRYGQDVSGYYIDGGLPPQVDAPRLRQTILTRQPGAWLIQNSGLNRSCVDYAAHERMEPPYPATSWLRCQTITEEWWAKQAAVRFCPELAYQYTVLQAAVTDRTGGGVAWSFGPHPGGRWELGVRSFCERLGDFVERAGASLLTARPSRAYVTHEGQPLVGQPYAATESPDGKQTYLHVFLPPKGRLLQLPAPADARRFTAAHLLVSGSAMHLSQTDKAVQLTLPATETWDDVDTIVVLE